MHYGAVTFSSLAARSKAGTLVVHLCGINNDKSLWCNQQILRCTNRSVTQHVQAHCCELATNNAPRSWTMLVWDTSSPTDTLIPNAGFWTFRSNRPLLATGKQLHCNSGHRDCYTLIESLVNNIPGGVFLLECSSVVWHVLDSWTPLRMHFMSLAIKVTPPPAVLLGPCTVSLVGCNCPEGTFPPLTLTP